MTELELLELLLELLYMLRKSSECPKIKHHIYQEKN